MTQSLAASPRTDGIQEEKPRSGATEPNGILVIDKPEGLTSFSVVARVKKLLRLKKAGHSGTLDPFATGVLLVCVNQATRIADQLLIQDKAYRFTIRFGVETDTLDRTGQVVHTYDGPPVSQEELLAAVDFFRGTYLQQVPRYAAVKVQGRRLYELARGGIEVDPPKREVHIPEIDLLWFRWPEASLEARCTKGTYVRQLASDIGQKLQCGAHVSELRRLASGPFRVEQAISLDDLQKQASQECWRQRLVPLNEALSHLPAAILEDERLLRRLKDGWLDTAWEAEQRESIPNERGPFRIVDGGSRLMALWWPYAEDEHGRRLKVL